MVVVHLHSAHIHYLPEALYKTIPKNYTFTVRNLKAKKLGKCQTKQNQKKKNK